MSNPVSMLKMMALRAIGRSGYVLVKYRTPKAGFGSTPDGVDGEVQYAPDMDADFRAMHARCREFTMTPVDRMFALCLAVRHVVSANVPGDIVECGVWRGGSIMLAALTLKAAGDTPPSRRFWLYDTFTGMAEPTDRDVSSGGLGAREIWAASQKAGTGSANDWCLAPLDDVRANVLSTGLDASRFEFVQGKVEETLSKRKPASIALLRLDTDWYESSRAELAHLYPLLSPGGVLIVDDYGQWEGQRQAVDEYFATLADPPFLARVDQSCRLVIKPALDVPAHARKEAQT